MKQCKRVFWATVLAAMLLCGLLSCGNKNGNNGITTPADGTTAPASETTGTGTEPIPSQLSLKSGQYAMVYATTNREGAFSVFNAYRALGIDADMRADTASATDYEIIIGRTARAEDALLNDLISRVRNGNADLAVSGIVPAGKKVLIFGEGEEALDRAIKRFIDNYVNGDLTVSEDTEDIQTYSQTELFAERRRQEEALYNAALTQEIADFEKRWDNSDMSPEQVAAVQKLYGLFSEELALWVAGLYDPEKGFYYSVSARDTDGFLPDIEDTAFAIGKIMLGPTSLFKDTEDFLSRMAYYGDDEFGDRMVKWVQSLQSPQDGFFYHPQWGKSITDVGLFRHYEYAIGILSRFGGSPLYKLPVASATNMKPLQPVFMASATVNGLPAYLESLDTCLEWVKGLDWSRNQTYHSATAISMMANTLKQLGYLDSVLDYIDTLQRENGTFEDAVDMASLNGVLKLTTLYGAAGRSFNRYDKVLDAVFTVIASDEVPGIICSVANPWMVLGSLQKMATSGLSEAAAEVARLEQELAGAEAAQKPALEEELQVARLALAEIQGRPELYRQKIEQNLVSALEKTAERLAVFKKPDGGFSLRPNSCGCVAVGVYWSLDLPESDVNGTALAFNVVNEVFKASGKTPVAIFSPETREKVLEALTSATSPEKNSSGNLSFLEDFESEGVSASSFWKANASGTTTVVSDENGNHLLDHVKVLGDGKLGTQITFAALFPTLDKCTCFDFKFDFSMLSSDPGTVMQIKFGELYMLDVVINADNTYQLREINSTNPGATGGMAYVTNVLKADCKLDTVYTIECRIVLDENRMPTFYILMGEAGHEPEALSESQLFFNEGLNTDAVPSISLKNMYWYTFRKKNLHFRLDNLVIRSYEAVPEEFVPQLPEKPEKPEKPPVDPDSVLFLDFDDLNAGAYEANGSFAYERSAVAKGQITDGGDGNHYLKYASPAGTWTGMKFLFPERKEDCTFSFSIRIKENDNTGGVMDLYFGTSYTWEFHGNGETFSIVEVNSKTAGAAGLEKKTVFTDLPYDTFLNITVHYSPTGDDLLQLSVSDASGTVSQSAKSSLIQIGVTEPVFAYLRFGVWTKVALAFDLDNINILKK